MCCRVLPSYKSLPVLSRSESMLQSAKRDSQANMVPGRAAAIPRLSSRVVAAGTTGAARG